VPLVGGVLLGELDPGTGGDLQMILSQAARPHHYQLTVTNSSGIGFVNAFQWLPPAGVQIVKVTGSSSGHCKLAGTSGFGGNQFKTVLLYPNILCDNINLKPPTCTCRGDGGSETISFIATQELGLHQGVASVISMTPVLKVVPSHVQPEDK
jgi:hypothetical protein